jgi:hypothetical protein
VEFARPYWIFIGAAMACATISSACTLYLAAVSPYFMECNPVAKAAFDAIGMVPSMVLGILVLLPLMVAIPYIFRQNEKPGLASMFVMGCIVAYTGFDAVNNISAILDFQQSYLVAHSVLSSVNNATGRAVGTGPSLC